MFILVEFVDFSTGILAVCGADKKAIPFSVLLPQKSPLFALL